MPRSARPCRTHDRILTGQDWGSIAGLLALTPGDDPNVVYSFHFYDPAELTSLAAYRPGLDRAALAQLPFPQTDPEAASPPPPSTSDPATRDLIRFYCATGWDATRVRDRLAQTAAWARLHGATLLAGEFGASAALNPAARLAWLRLVRETCAANGIGWALWGYDDVMGLNVRRPPEIRPALDRSVLKSLGLQYRERKNPRPVGQGLSIQGGFTSGRRGGQRPPSNRSGWNSDDASNRFGGNPVEDAAVFDVERLIRAFGSGHREKPDAAMLHVHGAERARVICASQ